MKGKKGVTLCATVLLIALTLCACGQQVNMSGYETEEITVSGLLEDEFTITPQELSELECVSRSATGATEKAGTVSVTGPLLDTFLAQYGVKKEDFTKIRFLASDSYKTVLQGEYLTDYEIIMGVSNGKNPLSEGERPLRLLIPEAESNKWIYSIVRIEFERAEDGL
ncbi:MAG: molybdopterin-dependent oxidoreductase [Oscillospiraceae bacterium]|nr:molybdopterin-dependent oxidoreductase [Oscillospiraceae bacterium]